MADRGPLGGASMTGGPGEPGEEARGAADGRSLGLWDTVSIAVGIVVGTAIFVSPPLVFRNAAGPGEGLALWLLGGFLSLMGALCYAELATAYPRSGGDYEYLTRAFGPAVGFLFAWSQLTVVLTGSIGAMAYAFAGYGASLLSLGPGGTVVLASSVVVVLTALNLAGVRAGSAAHNVLSIAKVSGLLLVCGAGLVAGHEPATAAATAPGGGGVALAMVFVLYAYGGWNDAAFVSAEVRDPRRNVPLALLASVAIITALYLVVNVSYLWVLGLEGLRATSTPASDVLARVAGPRAGDLASVLVMVSAVGAVSGLILTGARVFAAFGADHHLLSFLAPRPGGSPVGALLAQGVATLLLVLSVGTESGRGLVDAALGAAGFPAPAWQDYHGGFETLVAAAAPVFWTFFLLTGASLFVLRARDPGRERPFSVPLYPLPPLLFCASCAFMLDASVDYAGGLAMLAVGPALAGVPVYLAGRATSRRRRQG